MNNIIPNPIKLIDTEITNKVTLFYLFKFSKTVETSKIIKEEFDNQNIKCLHHKVGSIIHVWGNA